MAADLREFILKHNERQALMTQVLEEDKRIILEQRHVIDDLRQQLLQVGAGLETQIADLTAKEDEALVQLQEYLAFTKLPHS